MEIKKARKIIVPSDAYFDFVFFSKLYDNSNNILNCLFSQKQRNGFVSIA